MTNIKDSMFAVVLILMVVGASVTFGKWQKSAQAGFFVFFVLWFLTGLVSIIESAIRSSAK